MVASGEWDWGSVELLLFSFIPTVGFIHMGMVGRMSAPLLVPLPTEDEETSALVLLLSFALITTSPTPGTLRRSVCSGLVFLYS